MLFLILSPLRAETDGPSDWRERQARTRGETVVITASRNPESRAEEATTTLVLERNYLANGGFHSANEDYHDPAKTDARTDTTERFANTLTHYNINWSAANSCRSAWKTSGKIWPAIALQAVCRSECVMPFMPRTNGWLTDR